jgi:hypothetical protein
LLPHALLNALIFSGNFLGQPESFTIVAGTNVLKSGVIDSQIRKALEIFIHPDYSSETLENDIGVLKLNSSLTLNGLNVDAIALQHHQLSAGTPCIASGWGFQEFVSSNYNNATHIVG